MEGPNLSGRQSRSVNMIWLVLALYYVIVTSAVQHAARSDETFEGYAFLYFTGNTISGEKLFLAASDGNNALQWDELNGGQPILSSTQGSHGIRDPFVLRCIGGKKFYILATDLSIGSGTSWSDSIKNGSRYLEVWESEDLITFSPQRHVLLAPATAGNLWAPEAHWNDDLGQYMVYWASSLYATDDLEHSGTSYSRIMYATTPDFTTFSESQVWQDTGVNRIDTTVLQDGESYHRFTKGDGDRDTGCKDIVQESSTKLLDKVDSWALEDFCIGRKAGTKAIEGPTAFKANPTDVNGEKYYLFVDEYSGRGYIPLETADITQPHWRVSKSYTLPKNPRHGTVISVTQEELSKLTSHYSKAHASTKRQQSSGNPVLAGLNADPNAAIFEKTYYVYPTTDGIPHWGAKTFYVWKSTDLLHFTRSEHPILTLNGTFGNVPWSDGNAWAPTITDKDGKYFFYFSGNNPKSGMKNIGVAVADCPEGPFVAAAEPMITNTEVVKSNQAIDPDVFKDPVSGKYLFIWGNGTPLMAELHENLTCIDWTTAKKISGLEDFREGLFLVYRKGLYHLTYSIDDTGSENYRVGYATSPDLSGTFTYRGIVLCKDPSQGILGTGHNSIINVPGTDDWYIAYHRFSIPHGGGTQREVAVDRLTFDPDTGLMQKVKPTLGGVDSKPILK